MKTLTVSIQELLDLQPHFEQDNCLQELIFLPTVKNQLTAYGVIQKIWLIIWKIEVLNATSPSFSSFALILMTEKLKRTKDFLKLNSEIL